MPCIAACAALLLLLRWRFPSSLVGGLQAALRAPEEDAVRPPLSQARTVHRRHSPRMAHIWAVAARSEGEDRHRGVLVSTLAYRTQHAESTGRWHAPCHVCIRQEVTHSPRAPRPLPIIMLLGSCWDLRWANDADVSAWAVQLVKRPDLTCLRSVIAISACARWSFVLDAA